ncbi:adenosylcobinamide-GDP ribazoletransferase [Mesorhizobium sp.]|uniref:adenosylcobinamide-GDP ribazoletransferase n=4 Tax=unclassified Mesorhizobium TaxID=325217 RepID=UPI000FE63B17|nr:adenosylcobinamide-GDP ribazoletransferase [Mesorhizobium sp.]RWG28009.1 MAG: adenosylcobinamide-GDP ribazoletransferase [Mesorhizobium sp.]RWH16421.1 MAG: adenosylcobinamide-GDP ribazoletransferase [Mesorhizobium sp.]RWH28962.1 MAG: adenosylcobinamide-GDP ribazoletransferase [Mesorhizobium sp.]RWH31794.1 MAG: adenosylcobinamide-GDP ribazoletransferase [Mesorhizobium sp.]RWI21186.1 MAG: adenosylcobinamide-GDP ribazoletransferase [Mesorhizobium sp.]
MSGGLSEPRRLLDDIGLSLVFLTRLRLPSSDFGGRSLAEAIWAAPFAGLAIAVIGALVYAIVGALGLAAGPAAALALAATMLVTGCLHEDGLSDIADGLGGGRTREKKLEIMRDSRIGAYGAAALGISLLIRWSALSELAGPGHIFLALLAAHAASRGLFGAFMHLLPPARSDGLSADAGSVTAETAVVGAALGAVALLALGLGGAIAAVILLGLLFAAFRALCLSQIGGQTGDTIGALQQLGEIAVLLVASACLS